MKPASEAPTAHDIALPPELANVKFTNPDRVLFPEQGLTKIGLATYYARVAEWMLPHLVDRPLSIVRCPQGQGEKCFYQKHAGASVPDTVGSVKVQEKSKQAEYLTISDIAGLMGLVQIGALEIHPWGAKNDRQNRPDRLIFDLDPDPSVKWKQVIEAAQALHDLLDDLGLVNFVKTTGGKGLHVVVPIDRRTDWPDAKAFTKAVAERLSQENEGRFTTNMSKAARRGKIFIDYLRNDHGATSIAPYSTRAKPQAPVSVPLSWDELSTDLTSDHFNVDSLPARLSQLDDDPWAELFDVRQSITAAMKKEVGS